MKILKSIRLLLLIQERALSWFLFKNTRQNNLILLLRDGLHRRYTHLIPSGIIKIFRIEYRFLVVINFLFLTTIFSQAEKTFVVKVNLTFGKEKLQAEKWYSLSEKDSFLVENLKFYLSGIEFLQGDKTLYSKKNSFHLIDFLDSNSTQFKIQIPHKLSFSKMKINLGIDSLTNSAGAQGGALDPTTGMYWTWQSGYINFKLEGKSNLCETRNNTFTFHLGGFSGENNALQVLQFQTLSQDKIEINVDIQKFLTSIDLKTQNHMMSPSKEAVELARKVAQQFVVL